MAFMLKLFIKRIVISFLKIFPINKNKVFFSSFEGKSVSCNPKYVYEELVKKNKYKCVWEHNKKLNDIKTVKHNSLKYIYTVMTSKYIFTNNGISSAFPLRKKQVCVNTWHGSGAYKKVGKDISEQVNGTSKKQQEYINKNTTYFISGCEKFTEVMSNAIGLDRNKFLPFGMPRNTVFFKENNLTAIKEKIKIDDNVKICLYAPTFRGQTGSNNAYNSLLDTAMLKYALKERFGGEWLIAYRGHYSQSNGEVFKYDLDLSRYGDMQELLLVSDVLITDYSSSIWDYSFTYKPCFLYCEDMEDYKSQRDFYVPIEKWGFPIAVNNEQLKEKILDFDFDEYKEKMDEHHRALGSFENENAILKLFELLSM